jgi:hypothetical protein
VQGKVMRAAERREKPGQRGYCFLLRSIGTIWEPTVVQAITEMIPALCTIARRPDWP